MAGSSPADGPFIESLCRPLFLSLGFGRLLLFSAVILLGGRLFHLDLIFLVVFECLCHLCVLIFEFQRRCLFVFVGFLALDLLLILHDLVTITALLAQAAQVVVVFTVGGLLGTVKAPRSARTHHSVLFIDFASHALLGHLLARELEKLALSLSGEHTLKSERARVVLSCPLFFSRLGHSTALVGQEVA